MEFTQEHYRDSAGNERTKTTVRGTRRKAVHQKDTRQEQHTEKEDSAAGKRRNEYIDADYKTSDVTDSQPAPVVAESDYHFVRWIVTGLILIVIIIYRKQIKSWLPKKR